MISMNMAKQTCEELKRIPVSFLKEKNYLKASWIGGEMSWSVRGNSTGSISIDVDPENTRLRCHYTYHGDSGDIPRDYNVPLDSTPCYFGGRRYWFRCPMNRYGSACNRRVGVLYSRSGMFGCRRCQDAAYESQQDTHTGKLSNLRKFYQLEGKLSDFNSVGRVKYWRGQPTKRYRKILRDYARLEMLSSIVADTDFLL